MIALYGGTFNPVHEGHIALAREVRDAFELESVEFLPSYLPVHRDVPEVSAEMRKKLLEIALDPYPELKLNCDEINRQGASFAIDTLQFISEKFPQQALCWLMGVDAFNNFLSWKKPLGILQLANLIVCARPGVQLDNTILPMHHLQDSASLKNHKAGKIVFYSMQPNNCSSTEIRMFLKQGKSVSGCLSLPVLEFIHRHNLYTN